MEAQDSNLRLDQEKNQTNHETRESEKALDREELQWTNDTTLRYSENKSYADKYLKWTVINIYFKLKKNDFFMKLLPFYCLFLIILKNFQLRFYTNVKHIDKIETATIFEPEQYHVPVNPPLSNFPSVYSIPVFEAHWW